MNRRAAGKSWYEASKIDRGHEFKVNGFARKGERGWEGVKTIGHGLSGSR